MLLDSGTYDVADLMDRMRQRGGKHRQWLIGAFGRDPAGWADGSPGRNVDAPADRWLAVLAEGRDDTAEATAGLFDALRAGGAATLKVIVAEGESHRAVLRSLGNRDDPELAAILELVAE